MMQMQPFEDRQQQWTGALRQFRQHHGRNERPTVWEIEVQGPRVTTRFGLLNGAMQTTSYLGKVKNAGKKNEISAVMDALAEARRDCRKKWDFEGYDEYVDDANIDRRYENLDVVTLLSSLPGSFCLYKPKNELDDCKKLRAKADKDEVFYAVKRDGLAFWVVVGEGGSVVFYSRRSRPWCDQEAPRELPDGTLDMTTAVPWTWRFRHLEDAVRSLNLPPWTMLACELVAPGKDNLRYVSGLTKGHTDRAIADMALHGLPDFYVWDIPFLAGVDLLATKPVSERYAIIRSRCSNVSEYIKPISVTTFPSPAAALAFAKKHGLEGWVVVDPSAIYGDQGWSLKGKPDRPVTCAKCKPRGEDDFVAIWDPSDPKQQGSGKHEANKLVTLPDGSQVVHGGVGSVGLHQYNSEGKLIFICTCGSGMDYAFQANLREGAFPLVCRVEYLSRTYISDGDKTNALRNPVFMGVRDDKTPEECVNSRLDVEPCGG